MTRRQSLVLIPEALGHRRRKKKMERCWTFIGLTVGRSLPIVGDYCRAARTSGVGWQAGWPAQPPTGGGRPSHPPAISPVPELPWQEGVMLGFPVLLMVPTLV